MTDVVSLEVQAMRAERRQFLDRHEGCKMYPIQNGARYTGWQYRIWKHHMGCEFPGEGVSAVYPREGDGSLGVAKVLEELDEARPLEALEEIERLKNVIKTGGAMYRAERAALGVPGGIDEMISETAYDEGWNDALEEVFRKSSDESWFDASRCKDMKRPR